MPDTPWKNCTLDDLVDTNPEALGGSTPPRSRFRYIDINSVIPGKIDWQSVTDIDFQSAPSRARRIVKPGDTMFCTVRPGLQAHAYADWKEQHGYICSTGFAVLRPKQSDKRFIFHTVFSEAVASHVRRHEVGSSYPAVNESDLKQTPLRVPELAFEQSRIAETLDTLDAAIWETEAVIAKLRQVKAGLLHDLLARGLDKHGHLRDPARHPEQFHATLFGRLPKAWDVILLDEVAVRGSGHTPDKSRPHYWNGGVKWVSLADSDKLDRVYISTTAKEISEAGILNSSAVKHPPGVVILSRDAGIGKSAITTETMAVSQHFMAWRCGHRLDNHFLYYWFQFRKSDFESIAMGSTIKTIGLDYFRLLQVPVPKIQEQRRIGQVLLAADTQLFEQEEHISKLHSLKRGLAHDLLTGRVRVKMEGVA